VSLSQGDGSALGPADMHHDLCGTASKHEKKKRRGEDGAAALSFHSNPPRHATHAGSAAATASATAAATAATPPSGVHASPWAVITPPAPQPPSRP